MLASLRKIPSSEILAAAQLGALAGSASDSANSLFPEIAEWLQPGADFRIGAPKGSEEADNLAALQHYLGNPDAMKDMLSKGTDRAAFMGLAALHCSFGGDHPIAEQNMALLREHLHILLTQGREAEGCSSKHISLTERLKAFSTPSMPIH